MPAEAGRPAVGGGLSRPGVGTVPAVNAARRRLLAVPLAVALATALAACSGGSDGGSDAGRGSSSADGAGGTGGAVDLGSFSVPGPVDERAAAVRVCTDVLNSRDAEVFTAARDASVDMVLAGRTGGDGPDDAQADAWIEAMRAGAEALGEERDQLAEGLAGDTTGVADVVDDLDATIAVLEDRVALLEAGPYSVDDVRAGEAYVVGFDAEWAFRRDCGALLSDPGPAEGSRTFVSAAVLTCSTIVDRRRVDGYAQQAGTALEVVVQVLEGEPVEASAAQLAALETVRAEWQQTVDDLEAVPTEDVTDAGAWDDVVQLAQDRVAAYDARLAALGLGDQDAIAEAYDRSRLGAPGFEWGAVGLGSRDCVNIEA